MALTLHAAEDLLAAIQAGRMGPTSGVIDQALACLDQVSGWVDAFEAHAILASGCQRRCAGDGWETERPARRPVNRCVA